METHWIQFIENSWINNISIGSIYGRKRIVWKLAGM
jgi:hypothetical protein